ncbi:MAG: type II secretion system minor pseudopilin GspI [Gammaproteobacteria bacterium]|nr:type II secretion system minor pseudopilin GspI [Gammaproteobacteria bacterium]
MNTAKGFTLLEVLIALAVLAVALGTMLVGVGQYASNAIHIKEKTLASWVARNIIVEWQLQKPWPGPSRKKDRVEMAGYQWLYNVKVSNTDDPWVRRIDVDVQLNENTDITLASYVGYLEKR